MLDQADLERWRIKMIFAGLSGVNQLVSKVGLPDLGLFSWLARPVRPADISKHLRDIMLDRDNLIEDVNYQKVIPNRFVIEVSRINYFRQFQPIQEQIVQQMTNQILEDLVTANSRRGRKEFRFGGRLKVEIRPATDLKDDEARVLCRIEQEGEQPFPVTKQSKNSPALAASLEMISTGQRWALYPGINTIGRNEVCQIYIDLPAVKEKRLVSGQHAYILMEHGSCIIYDGSPGGRPSANGTYVNLRRIQSGGHTLQNGDEILLAAEDTLRPRTDTLGVVSFRIWLERKDG